MSFLGDDLRRVLAHGRHHRHIGPEGAHRYAEHSAPVAYAGLMALYRPLVDAALAQPCKTPALAAALAPIARELGLAWEDQ